MGGAAGHMRHPFDLEEVKSGDQLIQWFENAYRGVISKRINSSVKFDGVNTSIRFITRENEFGLDRGSQKQIDLDGVTFYRLEERFGSGHGMIINGRWILSIFNDFYKINFEKEPISSFRDASKDMSDLKNNPHYFLNVEFIDGKTNAIEYYDSYIVVHGIYAFHEVNRKGSIIRPGLKKEGKSSKVRNVSKDFIELLDREAQIYGFRAYGSVPVRSNGKNPDFRKALEDEMLLINYSKNVYMVRDMLRWLQEFAINKPAQYNGKDYDVNLKLSNGKKINPFHKKTYRTIIDDKVNISDLLFDKICKNEDLLSCGIVFLHATRILGREFLSCLTSDVGELIDHEGVVINTENGSVKITGDFIVNGMYGNFGV